MRRGINIILILTVTVAFVALLSQEAEGEADPFIDQVLYSRNTLEENTIVESGRDNATYYR